MAVSVFIQWVSQPIKARPEAPITKATASQHEAKLSELRRRAGI